MRNNDCVIVLTVYVHELNYTLRDFCALIAAVKLMRATTPCVVSAIFLLWYFVKSCQKLRLIMLIQVDNIQKVHRPVFESSP